MAHFKIIMHGDGVCIWHDSQSASLLGIASRVPEEDEPIIGFYTTLIVQGSDEADAVRAATLSILQEWSRSPMKDINRGAEPRLTVDQIEKMSFLSYLTSRPSAGYTFYTGKRAPEDKLH